MVNVITQNGTGYSFKLMEEFVWKDVVVPKGFISDGANIPRIFWSYIPPNYMQIQPAIVIHDYLCFTQEYEKANIYFKEVLLEQEVIGFKHYTLMSGVVFYAKVIRPVIKFLEVYKK